MGNQLRAAPCLYSLVFEVLFLGQHADGMKLCASMCATPPSALPPWSSQAFLSWSSCFHRANLQTYLQCTSKNCLVKPMPEHPLLCSKPPITSEEKAECWGLQDHSFLLPTPTVRLAVHCAPATLACCSSTSSTHGGALSHHIHRSILCCLSVCITTWCILTVDLFTVPLPALECECHEGRGLCLFCSLLYSLVLKPMPGTQ